MKKALGYTLLAGALALVATPASAQVTANADITASAEVLGNLTITGAQGLNFGFVVPTVTLTRAVSPTAGGASAAQWNITGTANAEIALTWTLPANLTDGVTNIPLAFAATDAAWADLAANQATATAFSPLAGSNLNISAAGALFVWLGGTINPGGAFAGAPGTYSATVNLQVAYTGN